MSDQNPEQGRTAGPSPPMVNCPNCGATVPVEYLIPAFRRASCPRCVNFFPIDEQAAARLAPSWARPPVALPRRFTHESDSQGVRISWPWLNANALVLLATALAWDGLVAVWLYTLAMGSPDARHWSLALFVAAGATLTYVALACVLNRTWIEADVRGLRVGQGPIPWPGGCDLPAEHISQLFARQSLTAHRGRTVRTYELFAKLDDAPPLGLVAGLSAPEQALYLEQELERALGIADRRVGGELPRVSARSKG